MIGIDPVFAEAGVEVRLGLVEARVSVAATPPDLDAALAETATRQARELADSGANGLAPVAATRSAYKRLGKDPSRYRPSAEALLRRALADKPIGRVNNVVDVNNLVSLATGYSSGVYDLDRIALPFVMRKGAAGESYAALGRGSLNLENLPLLADAEGAFGSPTSDSERSRVDEKSAHILVVVMDFGAPAGLPAALALLKGALENHAEATEITAAALP